MRPSQSTLKLKLKRRLLKPLFTVSQWLRCRRDGREPVHIDPRRVRRVLVVQFGGIGDVVRIFPMLQALERRFPHMALFTLTDQPVTLFDLMPASTRACRHLTYDFKASYPRKIAAALGLRRHRFDLVLMPARGDGVVETSVIAWLSGGRYRVGFDLPGAIAQTHQYPFCEDRSIIQQNTDLLRSLGIATQVPRLQLQLPPWARMRAVGLLARLTRPGTPVIALHPWIAFEARFRAWPIERYRQLVARLLDRHPDAHVVLLGSAAERDRAEQAFAPLLGDQVHNLAGVLDLSLTAALLDRCQLMICNDSSLLHIADALDVPTIVLFGATAPAQVLAPASRCHVVQAPGVLPCRPCYRHQPDFDWTCAHGYACMDGIRLQTVLAAAAAVLGRRNAA